MHESQQPPQQQERRPGLETEMTPRPKSEAPTHRGTGKLLRKVASSQAGTVGSDAPSPFPLHARGLIS